MTKPKDDAKKGSSNLRSAVDKLDDVAATIGNDFDPGGEKANDAVFRAKEHCRKAAALLEDTAVSEERLADRSARAGTNVSDEHFE